MIRRWVRWLSLTVIATGILLAGTLLLLRVALPQLETIQNRIEAFVSTWVQREVNVASMSLGWSGWYPELIASDLSVRSPDAPEFLVGELRIRFDPLGFLASRPWVRELVVREFDLQLRRRVNGDWELQGWVVAPEFLSSTRGSARFGAAQQVTVESVRLLLPDHNDVTGGPVVIDRLLYAQTDGRPRGVATGRLPRLLGGDFTLGFNTLDTRRQEMNLFVEAERIQWLSLSRLALGEETGPRGMTSGRVWVDVKNSAIQRIEGEHDTVLLERSDAGRVRYPFGHRFQWSRRAEGGVLHLVERQEGSGRMRLEYTQASGERNAAKRVGAESPVELGAESPAESGMESGAESFAESGVESGAESPAESPAESGVESGAESGAAFGMESVAESGLEAASEAGAGLDLQMDAANVDLRKYHVLLSALPLASEVPVFPANSMIDWREWRPSGNLSALNLRADSLSGQWRWQSLEAVIEDLAFAPTQNLPGAEGLDVSLQWWGDQGRIGLQSLGGRLNWPQWFSETLDLDTLRGFVDIRRAQGSVQLAVDELFVANADLAFAGRGALEWGEFPNLDLSLQFLRADAANIHRYWPRHFIPPRTRSWLVNGVRSARLAEGGMVFRGNPREFPFRDQEGIFDLYLKLLDAELNYREGWPEATDLAGTLRFLNDDLIATGVTGRILDVNVTAGEIRVDGMNGDPVLSLSAVALGGIEDFRAYLRTTGLEQRLRLDGITAEPSGPAQLDLQLAIPLHTRNPPAPKVEGRLDLMDVRVDELPVVGPIEMLRGSLRFASDGSLRGEAWTAMLRGQDLTLSVYRSREQEPLRVTAEGLQSLGGWLSDYPEVARRARGEALWRAEIIGRSMEQMDLVLTSDLDGLRLDLPTPLGKTAATRKPLEIQWPLARPSGRDAPGMIRIGDGFRADLRLAPGQAKDPGRVQSAAIAIGAPDLEDFRLPRDGGVDFRLQLPRLDVDAWLAIREDLMAQDVPLEAQAGIEWRRVDLVVGEQVYWRGRRLPQVSFHYRMGAEGPSFRASGPWIAGTGVRRENPEALGDLWAVDLDYISLAEGFGEELRTRSSPWLRQQDPQTWPKLRLRLGSLELGGWKARDLELQFAPMPEGLQIEHVSLRAPAGDLRLRGAGLWTGGKDQVSRTRFRAGVSGDDWGAGLRSMGLVQAMDGGKGAGNIHLEWPGSVIEPDLKSLSGGFDIRLESGVLSEVEPGAGRLLGLLSLDLIPRRLRLDFRDVYTEGLSFDNLDASGTLSDGELQIPGLQIRSPSAIVEVKGRTGLLAQDFDQHITVVPRLRSTLPVMGALLGGPVTGALVLVVERILGLGEQVENAAKVEYFVSGPWSEPTIRARVRADSSSPEQER